MKVLFLKNATEYKITNKTRAHGPHRSPEKTVKINKHI